MSPLNATTSDSGSRYYTWGDEKFTSVTTIIKAGTPTSWPLQRWLKNVNVGWGVRNRELWLPAAEQGHEEAAIGMITAEGDRVRDSAAVRGTEVHDWAERIVLGTAVGKAPEAIRPYAEQFARFLTDWSPDFQSTEATVYNRKCGYAGTLDWTANIKGHGLVLGDIKTKLDGKDVYGDSLGLQLAAYRYAEFIGLPDGSEVPMPEHDVCMVLVIRPSSYDLRPVNADEAAFAAFRQVQGVMEWCEVTSKKVIGRKLYPTKETA